MSNTSEPAIRVLIIDDHPMWRESVARDLTDGGYEVVATLEQGSSAAGIAAATHPHVAVVDLQLPDMSGVDVVTALLALEQPPAVLVLSASGEPTDVLAAVKAGATGYLTKSATRTELLDAVAATARHEVVFSAGLAGLVLGEFRRIATGAKASQETSDTSLTEREVEVLRLVATGLSYKQIAERLVLSHRTVQNHVQSVLRKLQLHNRVELTRFALEHGLDSKADSA